MLCPHSRWRISGGGDCRVHEVRCVQGEEDAIWGAPVLQTTTSDTVLQPHKLEPVSEVLGDPCSQLVTGPHSLQLHPEQWGALCVESTGEVKKANPQCVSNVFKVRQGSLQQVDDNTHPNAGLVHKLGGSMSGLTRGWRCLRTILSNA